VSDRKPGEGSQPVTIHRVTEVLEFTCPCCGERLVIFRDEGGAQVVPSESVPRVEDEPR
jgi:hypothetical protein